MIRPIARALTDAVTADAADRAIALALQRASTGLRALNPVRSDRIHLARKMDTDAADPSLSGARLRLAARGYMHELLRLAEIEESAGREAETRRAENVTRLPWLDAVRLAWGGTVRRA